MKAIWLVCCALVLLMYLINSNQDGSVVSELRTMLVIAMTVLTFPSGLLAIWLTESAGISGAHAMDVIIDWLAMALLGYIQWFVLPAWLARRKLGK